MGGVVVGRSAPPRPVEGGHVAVTVGGLIGALAGASVGWELFPLLAVEGDPNIGAANLAIVLMALVLAVPAAARWLVIAVVRRRAHSS
jgi:hypothetical protein